MGWGWSRDDVVYEELQKADEGEEALAP